MPTTLKACPQCSRVYMTQNQTTCPDCGPLGDENPLIVISIPAPITGTIPHDHPAAPECYWSYTIHTRGYSKKYTTSCGFEYIDTETTVEERFTYCPNCGHSIKNMSESDGL